MPSDAYVGYHFYKASYTEDATRRSYFEAILTMLTLSMALQLIMVWVNNKRRGKRILLLESLPVLVGLKPAVDAFRVARGFDKEVRLD